MHRFTHLFGVGYMILVSDKPMLGESRFKEINKLQFVCFFPWEASQINVQNPMYPLAADHIRCIWDHMAEDSLYPADRCADNRDQNLKLIGKQPQLRLAREVLAMFHQAECCAPLQHAAIAECRS